MLDRIGLKGKEKWSATDFYGKNKQWDSIFVGTKNNCKIICNGNLSHIAFEKDNPFLSLRNCEIASIVWNETAGVFRFCLIKDGQIIRSMSAIDDEEIEEGFGTPLKEETEIKEDNLFDSKEVEEIIENEGIEYFKNLVKYEKICIAANNLAKRYIGVGLVEIQDRIEMIEYN